MKTTKKNNNSITAKARVSNQRAPKPGVRDYNETFFPEKLAKAKEIVKEIVWLPK